MPNEQNLKYIAPGELSKEEAAERGRKGGINSVKSRRRKKLLRECLEELLDTEQEVKINGVTLKKTNAELLSVTLMKKALKGDVKAFDVLRDTAGEKPIDKVMVADVDQSVIDEVESMVENGEKKSR